MKTAKLTAAVLCLCLLSGCAGMTESVSLTAEQTEYIETKENTENINYEVPENIPKILVNQVGYHPESDKIAVFRGENLPTSFYVINAETEAIVYTGRTEEIGYDEELAEYNSYGTFSTVKAPGKYYIMADVIGMSYPFEIREDIYEDVYAQSFRSYADDTKESETDVICETLSALLLSYELYADAYTDDMNIMESGNGIPDILDVMKKKTEQLYARYDEKTGAVSSDGTDEDAEATLYFAAVMAKFSNTYKRYDAAYAETCRKAAGKAFTHVQNSLPEFDRDMVYFAAAELYRVTGAVKYATVLNEYASLNNRTKESDKYGFFYGDITYLSTTFKVDTKMCEKLIEALMNRVEEIAGDSKTEAYLTCGNKEQDNNEELLADMEKLSVVNYIIANHEYDTVLENHLHYFLGRNTKCLSYVENAGYTHCAEEDAILNHEVMNARFLCMLSAIR